MSEGRFILLPGNEVEYKHEHEMHFLAHMTIEMCIGLTDYEFDGIPCVAGYKARVAELEAAVADLLTVEWVQDTDGVNECLWCGGPEPHHYSDCPRQKAAALVQPEAERAAVPEATVCPGHYCDDGCQMRVGS